MLQSAGTIIIDRFKVEEPKVLILRAYKNWDFPKGLVEEGESKLQAAVRETLEETGLSLGVDFTMVGGYAPEIVYGSGKNKKTARYYIAGRVSKKDPVLPINPELGKPEHHEWRWAPIKNLNEIMPNRLKDVVNFLQEEL